MTTFGWILASLYGLSFIVGLYQITQWAGMADADIIEKLREKDKLVQHLVQQKVFQLVIISFFLFGIFVWGTGFGL